MMTLDQLRDFVLPLIGKPYDPAGFGPDVFNCWGVVYYVGKHALGYDDIVPIPDPPSSERRHDLETFMAEHGERARWTRTSQPVHGGIVEMGIGPMPHHVGLYLTLAGGSAVLHAQEGLGVCWDALPRLRTPFGIYRTFSYLKRLPC